MVFLPSLSLEMKQGEGVCSSLDRGQVGGYQSGCALHCCHVYCLGSGSLQIQETSGWDLHIQNELLPSCRWQGDESHCGALCVCRAVGVFPCRGNAGTSLSPVHKGWQSPSLPSASPCCGILSIHIRHAHS